MVENSSSPIETRRAGWGSLWHLFSRSYQFSTRWRFFARALTLLICLTSVVRANDVVVRVRLVDATSDSTELTGRVLLTAKDGGILLEEAGGMIHNLTPAQFREITVTEQPWARLDADALSTQLLNEMGNNFRTRATSHYVICSSASETETEYVAELMEKVFDEFFEFFDGSAVALQRPDGPLAVILFDNVNLLREHARQTHPGITFDNVPGYYSSRTNQAYLSVSVDADSRSRLLRDLRKQPRLVETMVHEAVHQLGYNSRLHVRFADNPLWFTEGLALYFEPWSEHARLLWSGPGGGNSVHLATLKARLAEKPDQRSLTELIQDNELFQSPDSGASAYALSWGLMYHLARKDRPALERVATTLRVRTALIAVPADEELAEFETAAGHSPDGIEPAVFQTIHRLTVRRR